MSRREIFQNNTSDTLSASCISTDLTISVTTGSKFPTTGDFHVLVDSEIMLVTARATNTLTVTRGQEGTTAAAHSNAAVITLILTAASLKAYLRDNVPGADGSKPAMRLVDSSGNPLTSSSFTAVNTTNATISDLDGGIVMRKAAQAGVQDMALLYRAYTAPATVIAGFRALIPNGGGSTFPGFALGFRDSVSGKLNCSFILNNSDANFWWQALRLTDPTTAGTAGSVKSVTTFSDMLWLKCEDDNTNLKFSISIDGVNWIQLNSEARGAYVTGGPTGFFWGVNNYGNTFVMLTSLVSWVEG
jgi:hypothetical protein